MVAIFVRGVSVGVIVGVLVTVGLGVAVGSVGVALGVSVGPSSRNNSVSRTAAASSVHVGGTSPVAVGNGRLAISTWVGTTAWPGTPWQAAKMRMNTGQIRENRPFVRAILCNLITVTRITTAVIPVNHPTVLSHAKELLYQSRYEIFMVTAYS
jgi:hypothetical protein